MNYMKNHPVAFAFSLAIAILSIALFASGLHAEGFAVLMAEGATPTIEDLAKEFAKKNAEFTTISGELRDAQKELKGRYEKDGKLTEELKGSIDKLLTNFNELKGNMDEMEKQMASRVEEDQKTAKTWGEQLVETERYKGLKEQGSISGKRTSFGAEVKQVTSAAAGGLIRQPYVDDLVSLQRSRRVIRDLLTTIPVQEAAVTYAKQTTRTNNAAPVAEGAAKPYSDYAWTSATAVVRTIAHLAKLTRQAMDDAPRLVGEVDSEMRYGLGLVEENQILFGNGTGENLNGIVPQATAFARPAGVGTMTGVTRADTLRIAILQAALSLYPADGIVISQIDWAMIELLKDSTGAYLFGGPQGSTDKRMWGLPVVDTPAQVAGDFLVGGFKIGATVYDRMSVELLISTENADDFEKNLATMRAEERLALAVKRPGAFIKGTFSTAKTALEA